MVLSQSGKLGQAAGETPAGHTFWMGAWGRPVRGTPNVKKM